MDNGAIELSHNEISLLVFAIEGGNAAPIPDASSCEEACPVVESVEELLCGGTIDPKQQLVRHLNNHLREGLIECGMFELMAAAHDGGHRSHPKPKHNSTAPTRGSPRGLVKSSSIVKSACFSTELYQVCRDRPGSQCQ